MHRRICGARQPARRGGRAGTHITRRCPILLHPLPCVSPGKSIINTQRAAQCLGLSLLSFFHTTVAAATVACAVPGHAHRSAYPFLAPPV